MKTAAHPYTELKLVLKTQVTKELMKPLNVIASKLGYETTYELWQQIQHIDIFFQEQIMDDGVSAAYDKTCKIIDFRDGDGTLVFYVSQ